MLPSHVATGKEVTGLQIFVILRNIFLFHWIIFFVSSYNLYLQDWVYVAQDLLSMGLPAAVLQGAPCRVRVGGRGVSTARCTMPRTCRGARSRHWTSLLYVSRGLRTVFQYVSGAMSKYFSSWTRVSWWWVRGSAHCTTAVERVRGSCAFLTKTSSPFFASSNCSNLTARYVCYDTSTWGSLDRRHLHHWLALSLSHTLHLSSSSLPLPVIYQLGNSFDDLLPVKSCK